MGKQRNSRTAEHGQRLAQLRLVGPGEAVDTGMYEEALEAGHASFNHPSQMALIAAVAVVADHAAPGHPIDPCLSPSAIFPSGSRSTFGIERFYGDRLRR